MGFEEIKAARRDVLGPSPADVARSPGGVAIHGPLVRQECLMVVRSGAMDPEFIGVGDELPEDTLLSFHMKEVREREVISAQGMVESWRADAERWRTFIRHMPVGRMVYLGTEHTEFSVVLPGKLASLAEWVDGLCRNARATMRPADVPPPSNSRRAS